LVELSTTSLSLKVLLHVLQLLLHPVLTLLCLLEQSGLALGLHQQTCRLCNTSSSAVVVVAQAAVVVQVVSSTALRRLSLQVVTIQSLSVMAVAEVLPARLVAMGLTQALTALLRMAVVVAVRVKQVGAQVRRVEVLVKTQLQHLVHLPRDLLELQDQVQMLQLAPVVAAAQVQLVYVDSFIRNTRVLNAPRVATVATDFNIQFLDPLCITAVAVAADPTTTPARLLILGVAAMAVAVTEQMRI
jgi:hypothetical protein